MFGPLLRLCCGRTSVWEMISAGRAVGAAEQRPPRRWCRQQAVAKAAGQVYPVAVSPAVFESLQITSVDKLGYESRRRAFGDTDRLSYIPKSKGWVASQT